MIKLQKQNQISSYFCCSLMFFSIHYEGGSGGSRNRTFSQKPRVVSQALIERERNFMTFQSSEDQLRANVRNDVECCLLLYCLSFANFFGKCLSFSSYRFVDNLLCTNKTNFKKRDSFKC